MTPDDGHRLSRRAVICMAGGAIVVSGTSEMAIAATPLTGDVAGSAASTYGVDTQSFHARNHGVVGDGRTDDTRAVQRFLDFCARHGGRIASFDGLTVRITGPLVSRGVGIVFDTASYGGRAAPGFVVSGANFTALTVVGSVTDFCVTLTGDGTADITEAGKIDGDRRPRVNGIAFGTADTPFGMSNVRWVRVNNLAGFGVRHTQCWDCTFLSISVERCGHSDAYAFEVAGNAQQNCNETTWLRIQVEQSIGGAMRIDPGTLSCSFTKIHSERAIAGDNVVTWLLGGSSTYDSVRLTATNPAEASLSIVGNQTEFRNLRAENNIPVMVNASGGTISFHNPGAVLQPAPNQNGIINIFGGVLSVLAMGGGWNLYGCRVGRLEVGYMPPDLSSTVRNCVIDQLAPQAGVEQGDLVLISTRVAAATISGAGRLRSLQLSDNTQIVAKQGVLECSYQTVIVDPSSRIVGDVVLDHVKLRLEGVVTGNLTVRGPMHDARAFDGSSVDGKVLGWGPPTVSASNGAWGINLATDDIKQANAAGYAVVGWRYAAGSWREVRVEIKG